MFPSVLAIMVQRLRHQFVEFLQITEDRGSTPRNGTSFCLFPLFFLPLASFFSLFSCSSALCCYSALEDVCASPRLGSSSEGRFRERVGDGRKDRQCWCFDYSLPGLRCDGRASFASYRLEEARKSETTEVTDAAKGGETAMGA